MSEVQVNIKHGEKQLPFLGMFLTNEFIMPKVSPPSLFFQFPFITFNILSLLCILCILSLSCASSGFAIGSRNK